MDYHVSCNAAWKHGARTSHSTVWKRAIDPMLMLSQRYRRWANGNQSLGQHLVCMSAQELFFHPYNPEICIG